MGSWKMEIFRMTLYVMFPVAMFHYFNQPKYFEEWVVKTKRELYPPETEQLELRKGLQKLKEQQELAYIQSMEEKKL